ncbi:uncharacterized protein LOC107636703 [Arachis ipaensis]|uniref:uncharacterized protein LOC107636703 n=1 Tax=Arachis ipaensis TaxID=130454 RepID=UPI0007AF591D|nr:uncharacterized protein LOC107636703 [Arachis ipaensis]
MEDAKLASIPMKLSKGSGTRLENFAPYRRLIGHLIYLINTWLDITFADSKLNQYLDYATDSHFKAGLYVLRYLKQALLIPSFFPPVDLSLTAYSDSDWGACPDSHRSVSDYCYFLGQSLISWKSKKQTTMARSSVEAEYCALALATYEGLWLSYILRDSKLPLRSPIRLYRDNNFALHIAANPVFHEQITTR